MRVSIKNEVRRGSGSRAERSSLSGTAIIARKTHVINLLRPEALHCSSRSEHSPFPRLKAPVWPSYVRNAYSLDWEYSPCSHLWLEAATLLRFQSHEDEHFLPFLLLAFHLWFFIYSFPFTCEIKPLACISFVVTTSMYIFFLGSKCAPASSPDTSSPFRRDL